MRPLSTCLLRTLLLVQVRQGVPAPSGDLAQMVERSLSMREALGSMPRFSKIFFSAKLRRKRQRRGSNPRGQSPLDFKSNSLTSRTHCLVPTPLHQLRNPIKEATPLAKIRGGLWRNGSASDSRSDGWAFESLWPHFCGSRGADRVPTGFVPTALRASFH